MCIILQSVVQTCTQTYYYQLVLSIDYGSSGTHSGGDGDNVFIGVLLFVFFFFFFFNHLQLQTLLYVKYIVKFTELIIKAYVRDGGGSFFLSFMWFVSSSWLNQSCMLHLTVALVSKCFFFFFFF